MRESFKNYFEEPDNSNSDDSKFNLLCCKCGGFFSTNYNIDEFPKDFICTICESSTESNDHIRNNNEKKGYKKLGRKTKREKKDEGGHNKYTFDNLLKKSKGLIINEVFHFINKKISFEYNGNIGLGTDIKKLMLINYEQIGNCKIDFNKAFLRKTLGEIFSVKLSKRTNNYDEDFNEKLIGKLKNEKDYFNELFNLTFLDCLKYFRGEEDNKYIDGLIRFNDLENDGKFKEENEKKYIKELREFILEFEKRLSVKKGRNPYKKKQQRNSSLF